MPVKIHNDSLGTIKISKFRGGRGSKNSGVCFAFFPDNKAGTGASVCVLEKESILDVWYECALSDEAKEQYISTCKIFNSHNLELFREYTYGDIMWAQATGPVKEKLSASQLSAFHRMLFKPEMLQASAKRRYLIDEHGFVSPLTSISSDFGFGATSKGFSRITTVSPSRGAFA